MTDAMFDQPRRAPEAPEDVAALNAWIDAQLGRTLTLGALLRAGSTSLLDGWSEQLPAFPRVRLLVEVVGPDASSIPDALARAVQHDPDALLICDAGDDGEDERRWRSAILDVAEGRNLFERMLIALCGPGMTRSGARAHSFEDGYATDQPMAQALAIIAREALTRETFRRYGSSPPCYL